MDAMVIVLGVLVLILASALGWLLVQRGSAQGKLAGAEEAARGAESRSDLAEKALAQTQVELKETRTRAETAERERAGLIVELRASQAANEAALNAANAEHELELDKVRSVHLKELEARNEAHRVLEQNLGQYRTDLKNTFNSLAGDALKNSTDELIKLADKTIAAKTGEATIELDERRRAFEKLIEPIGQTLAKTDKTLSDIEEKRGSAYAGLVAQVQAMQVEGSALRAETHKLVRALRDPNVRGAYGQIQLERVAELAGMKSYCDFSKQHSTVDSDGNALRPDMVVRLPNGRELVIDAKANIKAYLDATESTNAEDAAGHLDVFARSVLNQAKELSKKKYWSQYEGSPEFVIMFLPGDQFVDAALARQPDLLEIVAEYRVILASPGSLIAMLRAVQVGFAEQRLSEEARTIRDLVREMHKRLVRALEHAVGVRSGLNAALVDWNKFVGSFEQMLAPQLRRIEDAGAKSEKQVPPVEMINVEPRVLNLSEQVRHGIAEP